MIWIFNREDRLVLICSNDNPDALPIISAEMHEVLNGDLNLDFEVPLDHTAAALIEEGYSAAVQRENGTYELFIISEIQEIKGTSESTLAIACRHAVQELNDDPINEYIADRKSASIVLPDLLAGTRWKAGTVENTSVHDLTVRNKSVLEALTTFIERWEGEISYSFEIFTDQITRTIHFHQQRGQDAGRRFEWTRDLESLKRTIDTSEIKTALIGIGSKEIITTDANGNETTETVELYFTDISSTDPAKPAGQNFIEDPEARDKWGRIDTTGTKRNRFGFFIDEEINDAQLLLNQTYALLQVLKTPKIIYEIEVLDLAKVEGALYKAVSLGDTVRVIDDEINIQTIARVLEIKHDLIQKEKTKILLDNFQDILTAGKQVADTSLRLDQIEREIKDKIDRGETIRTEWLENTINLLTQQIRAGGGTVTMNEGQGILIEEDPTNKTGGAIRLLGGKLALANTYNAALGDYDWRTFGTGTGILADLVEAGKISFNNASGGELILGGENNKNGTLIVHGSELNETGQPIETVILTGDRGGFDKLSIGQLTNTHSTNIITNLKDKFPANDVGGSLQFYVDSINGSDNNTGTKDNPKSTVQSIIDSLPKYLDKDVYINVLPTLLNDTSIEISGFIGDKYIYIQRWDIGKRVRYIRDTINGSTANTSNHWVEIRGIGTDGGIKHAGAGTYPERVIFYLENTGEDITTGVTNPTRASDGTTTTTTYADAGTRSAPVQADVYLGGVYDLEWVEVFHYYGDGRTYYDTKTEISEDRKTWYTVYDSARQGTYKETDKGNRINVQKAFLNGYILLGTNSANVQINDIVVNAAGTGREALNLAHTQFFESRYSVYLGDSAAAYTVFVNGSNARMITCETNIAKTATICCAYGGSIEVYGVKGSGAPYGLYAHSTGKINGGSFSPLGSTANFRTYNGGRYEGSWTATTGEWYAAPIVQKTDTWAANDTQSLYGTNWTLTDNIYQGKRPTESTAWYGVAFFNGANFSALQGRAIRKVRVKLQRSTNTGDNTSRKPTIYYNMQTSASGSMQTLKGGHTSSVGFLWGEEKWIDLPISYGEAFRDGTAESLVLWVGSSETQYMKMEAKATLEITHG